MKTHINLGFTILILALANVTYVFAQTCQPAAPDLVSWYSGDAEFLQDFSTNSNGITTQSGTFTLENGQLKTTTNAGSGVSAGATVNVSPVTNPKFSALVTAQILMSEGPQMEFVGANNQTIYVDFTNGNLRIVQNGSSVIAATAFTLPLNTQLPMSLEINGGTVTGKLGTATVSAATSVTQPIKAFSFGGYFNGEVGLWDNIEITSPTSRDLRSRNNGTLENGATFAAGQVGQAFDFDGVNDVVSVADNPTLQPSGSLTIEAWINPNVNITNSTAIISKWNDIFGNNTSYALSLENGNNARFSVRGNNGVFVGIQSTTAIPLNAWTHVAGVFDAQSMRVRLYVNGSLNVTSGMTDFNSLLVSTAPLLIGAGDFGGGRFFLNGQIDEAAIYNRALSVQQIAAIHVAGTAGKCKPTATLAPSGQVAWLAGDGDTRDVSGNDNNGAFVGGSSFAVGKVGQNFNFNSNQTVQVSDNATLDFTNAFSIEMWISPRANGLASGQTFFIGKGNFALANAQSYGIIFTDDRKIINRVGNGSTLDQSVSNAQIPLNAFTHIATTYDGSTLRIYINGVLDSYQTTSIGILLNSSQSLVVGGAQSGGGGSIIGANAAIDETSLYNRTLSDAEIESIFNAGIAGKLKQSATSQTTAPNPPNLISLYKGEGNALDTQAANNGTFTANTYAPGQIGQAFQAGGGSVSVPDSNSLDFTNAYTIEMWVSPSVAGGTGGDAAFLACKGNCSVANDQPYSLLLSSGRVILTVGNSSTIDRLGSSRIIPLNVFSHVVGTYDGTTMRIYINGVLSRSKTTTIGTLVNSSGSFIFGGGSYSVTAGLFDEVALYNRPLTDAEILANYQYGNSLSPMLGDARVMFQSVTAAGTTQQIPLDKNLFPALPMGTHTGLFYDIDTSATFTGNPTVCFNLPSFTAAQFANLRVMHFENNSWVNVTATSNTYPTLCTVPITSFSPFAIVSVTPTAATVSIGGRVREAKGKGISRAQMTLTNAAGESRTVLTNAFGFYRFDEVAAGETYILSVTHKRRQFADAPRVLFVGEDLDEVDFTAATGSF